MATPPILPQRAQTAKWTLFAALILGLAAWIAITLGALIKAPGIGSFFAGLLGGFFVGLLIAGAGAWLAISILIPPRQAATLGGTDPGGEEIAKHLAPVLDELEAARLQVIQDVNQRALWRAPPCILAGIALWVFGQSSSKPGDVGDLLMMALGGGFVGYVWATLSPSNRYARLYKEKVLPKLAATFGDLSWRHAVMPDIAMLRAEQIFRESGDTTADDEIFGSYRNLPLNIVELKIVHHSGKTERTVFDGLLVNLDLPRDTSAVTAVVTDDGALGNFRDRMLASGRERVALEDPVFEKVYEVYGTDQIAARALLNPAFMERFLALGERRDFGRPLLLCAGRKLTIAFPKSGARNLFEPPSFRRPAASREELLRLRDDIAAVLRAADAAIDLDYRFEVQARQ